MVTGGLPMDSVDYLEQSVDCPSVSVRVNNEWMSANQRRIGLRVWTGVILIATTGGGDYREYLKILSIFMKQTSKSLNSSYCPGYLSCMKNAVNMSAGLQKPPAAMKMKRNKWYTPNYWDSLP